MEADARGVIERRGTPVAGDVLCQGLMRGLQADEACARAAGVRWERVPAAGEHGSPSDGREVGGARGGEGVGQR